jgi:hypothetical protein
MLLKNAAPKPRQQDAAFAEAQKTGNEIGIDVRFEHILSKS